MILPLFHHFAFFSENYKHKPKGFLLLKQPHAATEVPFIPFMRYIRPDLNKMMNMSVKSAGFIVMLLSQDHRLYRHFHSYK
jgi:hypothetical protein